VEGCGELGELEKFYGASYFSGEENTVFGYRDYRADRQLHLRNSHALLAVIERSFKGSGHRLLELGCAYGFLLEAARSRGWAPCGVDISAEAIWYAREELGLTVYQGEIDNCGFVPESFDAVCMIGTIEHMTDPVKALRSTARLLKMDGLLLITTIDVEGVFGYFSWKPPEHLFYFSSRSLFHLLGKAGFSIQLKRTYWKYYCISDLAIRLWGFWGLPGARRYARALERFKMDRLWVKIPTNEILVLARRG
jgi:SAM-dependent methyltransferase